MVKSQFEINSLYYILILNIFCFQLQSFLTKWFPLNTTSSFINSSLAPESWSTFLILLRFFFSIPNTQPSVDALQISVLGIMPCSFSPLNRISSPTVHPILSVWPFLWLVLASSTLRRPNKITYRNWSLNPSAYRVYPLFKYTIEE